MNKKKTNTYLSVVIPTCDRPNLLVNAVRSVPRNVTEIVIVNDGTSSIAPDVQADPRVKIVQSGPRSGPAVSRNMGASNATGEILLFLDDDDQLCAGYVDRILASVASEKSISCGVSAVIETIDGIHGRVRRKFEENRIISDSRPKSIIHATSAGFWIEKSKFEEVGGFDESLRVDEDTDLCLRLFKAGERFWYDSEPGVLYRVKSGSSNEEKKISEQGTLTNVAYNSYLRTFIKNFDSVPLALKFFLINRTIRRGMKDLGCVDGVIFERLGAFWWLIARLLKFKYQIRSL